MSFPKEFIWGTASASYQIEGGYQEDGKGLSIWDVFSHTPGKTTDGDTGDIACDAYHRYEEDLDLMQQMGIKNYRFSISWPRLFPQGTGEPNPAGFDYYDRLIDACRKRGITPWLTLYHWDLPQALEDEGGWRNRKTAEAFADYARAVASHYGDRIRNFITLNEPQCIVGLGYGNGIHAPGLTLAPEETFVCWHHLMLAHGLSSAIIREICPDAVIGISSTGNLCYFADHKKDIPQELFTASFTIQDPDNYFFTHQWFLDPVCNGHYPEDPLSPWYALSKKIPEEDLSIIHARPDYIGLNIYNGHEVAYDDNGTLCEVPRYTGFPRTALKWPVTPPVLYYGPRLVSEYWQLPVVITENGLSCNDVISLDGRVHDPNRIDFLHRYLREMKDAVTDGTKLLGYFHWAFTDNYEWHSGYSERFGLIYVDYPTSERIPKDSAAWYKDVIASNGEIL